MAPPELQIRGGDATVKVRNPVTSALLDLVTFGIYGIYWYFVTNRDLAALGRARGTKDLGDNPTNSLLALLPGAFVVIPFVISSLNTGKRIGAAQRISGIGESINAVMACVAMVIFFPVGLFYAQTELNKVWERETEGGAGGGGSLAAGPGASTPLGQDAAQQPAEAQLPPQAPGA
ncbi:MAG TPA: DUF4234 domain-containing protein [Thermoleophilaceae bacterium]|jgi:hypothetical protein